MLPGTVCVWSSTVHDICAMTVTPLYYTLLVHTSANINSLGLIADNGGSTVGFI